METPQVIRSKQLTTLAVMQDYSLDPEREKQKHLLGRFKLKCVVEGKQQQWFLSFCCFFFLCEYLLICG